MKKPSKFILIISGTICVGLGTLGIFLPLLPSTPFFLLAAACYSRSSQKFYNWLMNNRWFGSYIKNYREAKSIPLAVKVVSISLLWITISISIIFATELWYVRFILFLIAVSVTIHILSIKTLKSSD